MEFYQLEQFLSLAQTCNMHVTAEQLHITQPALSKSLKKLEAELECPLFERWRNKLVLNEYGKTVVEEGRDILNHVDELQEKVKNQYNRNMSMFIGSCAPAPLWALRYTMKRQYPDMSFGYETKADAEELIQGFNEHDYSAIILDYPINKEDVVCFQICQEVLNISTTSHHPLANKKTITFEELNGENFLEYNNTGYWHEVCVDNMPDSHFIVQDDLELYGILQRQSSLLTFRTSLTIPRFHLYEDRVYIPITNPEATLTFYLICHQNHFDKIKKVQAHINEVDWIHYRNEDFEII